MSEVMIPWAPGAVYTRVLCRLGMPRPDTDPPDGNPELIPISGKVSLTANIASARYLESDARYRYLTFGTWEFSIRASDGEREHSDRNHWCQYPIRKLSENRA